MKRLGTILFWSVIAAAFIGPGTVTTAARAGAGFGGELLWALTFSTLACLLLQEMASRSFLISGQSLGERIRTGFPSVWIRAILAAAIGIGGIAYEAGNLLGAVSGMALLFPAYPEWITPLAVCTLTGAAALTLWSGRADRIAKLLGIFVVMMGIMFVVLAIVSPAIGTVNPSSLVLPVYRDESGWLILGLIGTTIVPYNLFLGGSIGQGQSIRNMRIGLSAAVVLGGLISMAILLSAIGMEGEFSFEALRQMVGSRLGVSGEWMLGLGLLIAGFTSAVTAPWATALAVGGLFPSNNPQVFRWLWGGVLLAGLIFGILGLRPVPVIIAAQALNGLALPLVTALLLLMMNRNMGIHTNRLWGNLAGLAVLGISTLLGLVQLVKVTAGQAGVEVPDAGVLLPWMGMVAAVLVVGVGSMLRLRSA